MRKNKHGIKIVLIFIAGAGFYLIPFSVYAITPQFMVSWQAQSYAPSWFEGKIFPTRGSPVEIFFELILGGKKMNLQKTVVRWYVNDDLIKNETNGLGIQSLRFNIPDYPGGETEVRIALPDYNGQQLDKIIRIPVKAPEVVIDGRYPNREVSRDSLFFAAFPFFFTADNLYDLDFKWRAGNEEAGGSSDTPWLFSVNLDPRAPAGFSLDIGVRAKNFANDSEFAGKEMKIKIK